MEAQQRDVREYLLSVAGSIEQIKRTFAMGQAEVVEHIEKFFTSTLEEKLSEKISSINENIEGKFASLGHGMKEHFISNFQGMVGKVNDQHELFEKYSKVEKGRTKQMDDVVSQILNLLEQVHDQVSCILEIVESGQESNAQYNMENKGMMSKSNFEVNSFKSELYKLRSELERLIEGQTVIREDIADNKQHLSLSFKQIQRNLNKDVESQARLITNSICTSCKGLKESMIESHIQVEKKDRGHSSSIKGQIKDSGLQQGLRQSDTKGKNEEEISTFLEPPPLNASLNKSYVLWDLAARNGMPTKNDMRYKSKDFLQPSTQVPSPIAGTSQALLQPLHMSTPKAVGIVVPNVSRIEHGYEDAKDESSATLQITNNRSNKRAQMKKQRLVSEKLYVMKEGMQRRTRGNVPNRRTANDQKSLCYQLQPSEPFKRPLLQKNIYHKSIRINQAITNQCNGNDENNASIDSDDMFL
jgi:hypothetical protein